jgi:hypothetical protein
MRVEQLIKKLQEAQDKYGNLDVCFTDIEGGGAIDIGDVSARYPCKVGQIFIEDEEADPAFLEITAE